MSSPRLTLFLAGDVMTGRGIDQALAHPGDPTLHEPSVRDARAYLQLAEQRHGSIRTPLDWRHVWGDTLKALDRAESDAPLLRIINLETAVTTSDDWRREKAIHYRMNPANVPVLTAARIDGCVLANNHVLDWGHPGLAQTLQTLRDAGIRVAGAGADADEAAAPMCLTSAAACVRVFAIGAPDSGIPPGWAATVSTPGVNVLPRFDDAHAHALIEHIRAHREPDDLVVLSIHWGGNWGYDVPRAHRRFAHQLIDAEAVDVIHGHSSHHPKPIEIHRGRPILYGCGDLIDDYEGITGHDDYRPDLRLMPLVTLQREPRRLVRLRVVPMRARRFGLRRAEPDDAAWLCEQLGRHSAGFDTHFALTADHAIDALPEPAP